MSYLECISNALKAGKMTSDIADAHRIEFDKNFKKYKGKGYNDHEATRAAGKETYDFKVQERARKKVNVLQQARVNAQNKFQTLIYKDVKGNKNIIEAIRSIFDQDAGNQILSITNMKRTELGLVHAPIAEFLEKFRTGYFGRRGKFQKMTVPLIIKEILEPGSTANPLAKQFAKAINKSVELGRTRHNQFGGNVAKIKGNYLPQPHNVVKIGRVSQDQWINDILPKLDLERMINNKTARSFTREELVLELPSVYDAIRTEGVSRLQPGTRMGSTMTANKRLDHRFLVFKDAESYMAYQAKYGDEDVISTIYQHLESISRDTAMMRALGPNPNSGWRFLQDLIRVETKDLPTKKQLAIRSKIEGLENLYLAHSGRLNSATDKWVANMFAGLRHYLTSAVIGSATLLAQSDFFFTRTTSKFLRLPAYIANRKTLTLLKEGLKRDKTWSKIAIRSGLIGEHWSTIASAANRYIIDTDAPILAKMFSDATLRASGLSHLTQAGRWSFGMEFMGFLGDNFNKNWKQLAAKTKKSKLDTYGNLDFTKTLEIYGIREGDWDIVRKTKLYDAAIDDPNIKPGQALFFKPSDLLKRNDITPEYANLLHARIMEMIFTEIDHAIPTASMRGRATVMGKNKPGTFTGELMASGLMFKNFAIAIGFTHILRGLRQTGLKGKAGYLVPFLIGTTLMNAYSHEMREILKGRDLVNFKNMNFEQQKDYWLARIIGGGGLGIFGDLIYSEAEGENFGTDITDALLGLPVAFGKDTFSLLTEPLKYFPGGDDPNVGNELSKYIKKYTPGSSLWYLRAAWERIIVDTLQQLIDPDFHKRNQRNIKRYQKKEGRDYWWYPGDKTPIDKPTISP
jgi:hypothetical protein